MKYQLTNRTNRKFTEHKGNRRENHKNTKRKLLKIVDRQEIDASLSTKPEIQKQNSKKIDKTDWDSLVSDISCVDFKRFD